MNDGCMKRWSELQLALDAVVIWLGAMAYRFADTSLCAAQVEMASAMGLDPLCRCPDCGRISEAVWRAYQ